LGTWQGQGEILQFTNQKATAMINGQAIEGLVAVMNGQTIMYRVVGQTLILMYKIVGNNVTLLSDAGMLQIPYRIQGDVLNYQMNGLVMTCQRSNASQPPTVINPAPNTVPNAAPA